jgi:hypothetical protein
MTTAPPALDHPIHHDLACFCSPFAARVSRRADVCLQRFDQDDSAFERASDSTSFPRLLPCVAPSAYLALLLPARYRASGRTLYA